jgi:ankyrin repeat protein
MASGKVCPNNPSHLATVQQQLSKTTWLTVAANDGTTPTHQAAIGGHEATVRALVELCGREVATVAAANGFTPTHLAAFGGQEATVRALVELCGREVATVEDTTGVNKTNNTPQRAQE